MGATTAVGTWAEPSNEVDVAGGQRLRHAWTPSVVSVWTAPAGVSVDERELGSSRSTTDGQTLSACVEKSTSSTSTVSAASSAQTDCSFCNIVRQTQKRVGRHSDENAAKISWLELNLLCTLSEIYLNHTQLALILFSRLSAAFASHKANERRCVDYQWRSQKFQLGGASSPFPFPSLSHFVLSLPFPALLLPLTSFPLSFLPLSLPSFPSKVESLRI